MQVVKLRKLMILKDNPAFTYQHSNRKQAISRVHSLQDKIVEAAVDNQVYGNSDSVNHQKTVEQTISDALENDRKRVYKSDDNRYINTAVKLNTEKYSEILNNRLNIESVKLEAKIEEEIRKSKYNGLSEAEIKKRLTSEFGDTAKLRTANIIRDALHTNEVNIGFIHALQNGFQYKVWNNGRGKGKVRAWHRARFISSVSIDEPFDIFGSYHAEMMYPGDLNGGAENVANCRCWLSYTNNRPSNLRRKGSSSRSNSKSTQKNNGRTSNKKNIGLRIKERVSSAIENAKNKVLSRIKETQKRINSKIKGSIKSNKKSIKNTYNKSETQLKNYKNDLLTVKRNNSKKVDHNKEEINLLEIIPPVSRLKKIYYKLTGEKIDGVYVKIKESMEIKIIKQHNTSYLSFSDIDSLLKELPPILVKYVEKIKLYNFPLIDEQNKIDVGRVFLEENQVVYLFNSYYDKETYLNTLIHELAHILDHNYGEQLYNISGTIWEKAFNKDKEHNIKHGYDIEYGGFVTEYSKNEYVKIKYGKSDKPYKARYGEDFAESLELYLKNKEEFKLYYPNRAKVFKKLGV